MAKRLHLLVKAVGARPHKYLKRIAIPGGGYRYLYKPEAELKHAGRSKIAEVRDAKMEVDAHVDAGGSAIKKQLRQAISLARAGDEKGANKALANAEKVIKIVGRKMRKVVTTDVRRHIGTADVIVLHQHTLKRLKGLRNLIDNAENQVDKHLT